MSSKGHVNQDRLYLELKIDDKQLPANLPNMIEKTVVIEHMRFVSPMAQFVLHDEQNHLFRDYHIGDDNKISALFGDSQKNKGDPMDFRVFSVKRQDYLSGAALVLNCLTDAPALTKGIALRSIKCTASEAIKQIAESCGLTIDEDNFESSADSQVWINPGLGNGQWIQHILDHSYASASGLLKAVVLANKKIRLVDVVKQLGKKPGKDNVIAYGDAKELDGAVQFLDMRDTSNGGFLGSWVGYGHDVHEPRIDSQHYKSDGISIELNGPFAPLNEDTYSQLSSVRSDYAPHSGGSTHDKYWQAFHANQRKSALFTQFVTGIIYGKSKIEVLDAVDLRIAAHQITTERETLEDSKVEARSGTYIVIGKKKIQRGMIYAEIFQLGRITYTLSGQQQLLTDNGRGTPVPAQQDQGEFLKSKWTKAAEKRYTDPKYHCYDIVDEECMPTSTDSTDFDNPDYFTDSFAQNHGPYERALTGKIGVVEQRAKDTEPQK